MNQNDSSGSLIKPWPVLLDHYKALCNNYRQQSSLNQHHANSSDNTLTFSDFLELHQHQDPLAIKVAERAAKIIGQSLYNFLITLNINKIILYGNTCALGQSWLDTITEQPF